MTRAVVLAYTREPHDGCRLELRRPDGATETADLEGAGALVHDFAHFAVETEASLKGSFFGLLGKIGGYQEIVVAGGAALGGEIAITERVVTALRAQSADDDQLLAEIVSDLSLEALPRPRWLTREMLEAARARLRALTQQWAATSLGETLELTFDVDR